MKMDALWMVEDGKIEVRQVEIGDPGYGQVQIKIKACGICAWDLYLFRGADGNSNYPMQFGHEGVGIITKLGPGVENFKLGDKVFAAGGGNTMAQYSNLSTDNIAKIPDDTTDYSKWVGEPIACVVSGINQLAMEPGAHIVVIGTGFMGLLNVQGLSKTLAGRITTFDIDEKRLELAKDFGADEAYVVNSEQANKIVEEIKADGGADIVIECSGAESGLNLACDLLKTGGTLSLFAWHKAIREFDGTRWHMGGFRVLNTSPMIDPHFLVRVNQTGILMNRKVFSLDRLVTHVEDYQNAQKLFEIGASGAKHYIKGVISF